MDVKSGDVFSLYSIPQVRMQAKTASALLMPQMVISFRDRDRLMSSAALLWVCNHELAGTSPVHPIVKLLYIATALFGTFRAALEHKDTMPCTTERYLIIASGPTSLSKASSDPA